jgi:serine/threonine-protein kinase
MAATDPLVLPRDLLIIPVTELSAEVRRQFDCADSDYAVTRPNARSHSQIIDAAGAQLLEEFRTPKTVVQAILAYSQARQVDPAQTLERSFPFLRDLGKARFLVRADSSEADRIEPVFAAGEMVAGCEVLRCVQVLDDTEVYQVRDSAGRLGALKCVRPGPRDHLATVFLREAAILRHLSGPVAAASRAAALQVGLGSADLPASHSPALLAEGTHEGRPYLLLEWVAAVNVAVAADELRRLDAADAAPKLLALGVNLAEAYAWLHAQQVVHGDVHPRNVLVDDQGRVKLIDFGQAQFDPAQADWLAPDRAGIGFFFEPEYAQALRQQQPPPAASPQGEQYALGALLYFMFTGAHYLDFSVEPDKMFRQITDDPPLPFARRGRAPWPEVEHVLMRALHKDPVQRFASVTDLSGALQDALTHPSGFRIRAHHRSERTVASSPGATLLETTLHGLGISGPLLTRGVPAPPTASVNYGAAGIAYLFYRIACLRGEPQLLVTADLWANRARQESARPDAFYNPAIEITGETVGRIALCHTASGVHCVQGLISQALDDGSSARTAVQQFVVAARQPCTNLDLTLGLSSLLIGCATLQEALADSAASDATGLAALGEEILQRIWSQLDGYGPLNECSELTWLGIAHGWAGILYATLRWCQAAGRAVPATFLPRLEQLADCAEPAGRGLCWPRQSRRGVGSREPWSGWCNGSAGYVFLWTLASQATGAAEWLRLAHGAAWHAWEDTGPNGHGLCCGLAGRAYALLNLYRCTGDPAWLDRARELGQRAAASAAKGEPMPHSLYKGTVGVALLAADLEQPAAACMPLFEPEGWPPVRA